MRYRLQSPEQAKKSLAFYRTYRAYIFTYTLGEDLVRTWVGQGPDRWARFADLLQRPSVPTGLRLKARTEIKLTPSLNQ